MLKIIKPIILHFTSHEIVQGWLEKITTQMQSLMGIGSGGDVYFSGEQGVLERVRDTFPDEQLPLCIFDVGANVGHYVHLVEDVLGKRVYHIHAFEPSAATCSQLKENTKNSNYLTVNNIALGSTCGEAVLFSDKIGSGCASLYQRRLDHFQGELYLQEKINVLTIDDYCKENKIETIHLLKLDIEGHEMQALEGAQRMLYERRIKSVVFEFGGCNIDSHTYFQDFYYFFKEHGMSKIFRVTPKGYLAPIYEYKEIYEQFRTTNFFVQQDS